MFSENDVWRVQMGVPIAANPVGNRDYLIGAPGLQRGLAGDGTAVGRASLSLLALAILGLMTFYVITKSKQY